MSKTKYLKLDYFRAAMASIREMHPEWVSNKVKFPKVVLHSWIENQPTDKDLSVREITFIVEGYSNKSYLEAQTIADTIAEHLCNDKINVNNAVVVSTYTDGSDETEEEDNNNVVIYRKLNRIVTTLKIK